MILQERPLDFLLEKINNLEKQVIKINESLELLDKKIDAINHRYDTEKENTKNHGYIEMCQPSNKFIRE
jgi:hypothetical protein